MTTLLLGVVIVTLIVIATVLVDLLKTIKEIHTLLLAFHQREFDSSHTR